MFDMQQFDLGGILQGLQLKVQFTSSIIGCVYGIYVLDNGGGFMLHVRPLDFICELFVKLFNHFHDSNI
jgi:hypothetical protein